LSFFFNALTCTERYILKMSLYIKKIFAKNGSQNIFR
jgi:hypothetical protein